MASHISSLEICMETQKITNCSLSELLDGDTLLAEPATNSTTSCDRMQVHGRFIEKSSDELANMSKDERRAYHQARRALSQHGHDCKSHEPKSKAERRALQDEQRRAKEEVQIAVLDKRTYLQTLWEQRRGGAMLRNVEGRPLRVLALHGFGCCAEVFNLKRTKDLQRCLSGVLEIHCLDGFHELQHLGEKRRAWWNFEDSIWQEANLDLGLLTRVVLDRSDSFVAIGLDDSLSMLRDAWLSGEYDGILGFSQGATMTAMLLASLQDALEPAPKFCICVAGFGSPCPHGISFFPPKQPLKVPSLHVWGDSDDCVNKEQSQSLANFFAAECRTFYQHEGGHCVPQKVEDIDVIARFLEGLALDHG